jgi:hypothetical protein
MNAQGQKVIFFITDEWFWRVLWPCCTDAEKICLFRGNHIFSHVTNHMFVRVHYIVELWRKQQQENIPDLSHLWETDVSEFGHTCNSEHLYNSLRVWTCWFQFSLQLTGFIQLSWSTQFCKLSLNMNLRYIPLANLCNFSLNVICILVSCFIYRVFLIIKDLFSKLDAFTGTGAPPAAEHM